MKYYLRLVEEMEITFLHRLNEETLLAKNAFDYSDFLKKWIEKLEFTIKEYRGNLLGILKENDNLKEIIYNFKGLLDFSKTQSTILETQKDINEGRVNILKQKNLRDNHIYEEIRETSDKYYRLLQNNYVDLRNDYDDLMNKFCNLEMENARLLNSKQLASSDSTRVSFFYNPY